MTDLTHVNFSDIDGVLRRADAGDDDAKSAVQRNAREWLLQLLAGVATSRTRVAELKRENERLREHEEPLYACKPDIFEMTYELVL